MFNFFTTEIARLFKNDRNLIRQIFVVAVAIGFLELTIPFSVQVIINRLYSLYSWEPLFIVLFITFFLLIVHIIYLFVRFQSLEFFQRKIDVRLTNSIFKTVMADPSFQKEEYLLRYFEVVSLKKNISKLLTGGIGFFLALFFGLIILIVYNVYFGLLALFIIISHFLLIYLYHNKSCTTAIEESKQKYEIAQTLIKQAREKERPQYEGLIERYLNKRHKHFRHLRSQFLFNLFIFLISHILILAGGGRLVLEGHLTIGQLIASEMIFSVILASLANSVEYIEIYYAIIASLDKLRFIKEPLDLPVSHFEKFNHAYDRLYKASLFVFFFMPIFILLTPWTQTSEGHGTLTTILPEERVQEISALVDGRIQKWLVKEGDYVQKDQPLVELVDNDPDYAKRLKADADAAFKKYQAEKLAAETAFKDYLRQKQLLDQGLTSRLKLEKAQIEYQKLVAKEAEAASSLAKSEINYSRQQRQVVVAPSNGHINQLISGNFSSIVTKGTKLAMFIPEATSGAVEIFVSGNDIPLIHPGRKARLEFEGFPAFQFSGWPDIGFGTFEGTVYSVDSVASNSGKFRVLITPSGKGTWPGEKILRRGARVVGWIQMNQVSLGYELWRQFNGFPAKPDEMVIESYQNSKKEKK